LKKARNPDRRIAVIDRATQKSDKYNILIVDDTRDNLELLCRILKERGYRVRSAISGRLALRSVSAQLPDLILLDVKMPEMDGYAVWRRLKSDKQSRNVPVIFIRAHGETAKKVDGFRPGGVDYITKPFEAAEVLARVEIQLRLRELTENLEQNVIEWSQELHAANSQLQRELSERKKAEERLRVSEERLRLTLEATQVGTFDWDIEHDRFYFSPTYYTMLGYKPKEGPGDREEWLERVHPDDRDHVEAEIRKVLTRAPSLDQPREYTYEARLRHADGTYRWQQVKGFGIKSDQYGRVMRMLGIRMDITERKRAEEERQKVERHLRTIVENFPDFIARFDEQGRHLYINPAVEKGLGVQLEHYVGKTLHDLNTPGPSNQNDMLLAAIQQAFKEGTQNLVEAVWPTPQGDRIFEVRHIPELNDEGTVVSVIGVTRDITDRRQAEEEIEWNLAINQALSSLYIPIVATGTSIEQIADAVLETSRQLTTSAHGYVAEIDPATGDLIAHTSKKMLQTECKISIDELRDIRFPRKMDGLYNGLWGHALNTTEPFYTNGPVKHPASVRLPEGHIAIERFMTVPVLLAGKPVGQIVLSNSTRAYADQDLDAINRIAEFYALAIQHKRAEEQIRILNQELEQRVVDRTAKLEVVNKELEAFAYSVSHDLRAPLRHIDGFLELLQKRTGTALDDQSRHYMDTISGAANKMGLLIDDLLSFSRMGRHAMSLQPVDLESLVREIVAEFEPDVAGRTIHWRIGDLPIVRGDAAMLRMVLANLIANALKFTRPRQGAQIEIGSQPGQNSEAVIFVRDNGVGFDMAYADKLFGVFQRLHRAEEFEGSGIGLANVRRIINRHDGRTWAEGSLDHGATFYFSLPRFIKGA
jgi:PAS domain S-box-containing protein